MVSEVLAWKPVNYLVHDVRVTKGDKDDDDGDDNIVRGSTVQFSRGADQCIQPKIGILCCLNVVRATYDPILIVAIRMKNRRC